MATKPYSDIEENYAEDGASADPQYIADRDRDIRMCCVRTALDLHRTGDAAVSDILSEAKLIFDFLNGSAN